MWKMLQQSEPSDFVIATGINSKLSELGNMAFLGVGLERNQYVEVDPTPFCPGDLMVTLPAMLRKTGSISACI